MAGRLFQPFPALPGPRSHADPLDIQRQIPVTAPTFHEGGVGAGRWTPQAVIHVARRDEGSGVPPKAIGQVEQGHGIGTAGAGNQEAGRRRIGEAATKFGEKVGQRGYLLVITYTPSQSGGGGVVRNCSQRLM